MRSRGTAGIGDEAHARVEPFRFLRCEMRSAWQDPDESDTLEVRLSNANRDIEARVLHRQRARVESMEEGTWNVRG